MTFHSFVLWLALASMPLMLWVFWIDWRILQKRHRRALEALRWRHFEERMRLDRWQRQMVERLDGSVTDE